MIHPIGNQFKMMKKTMWGFFLLQSHKKKSITPAMIVLQNKELVRKEKNYAIMEIGA